MKNFKTYLAEEAQVIKMTVPLFIRLMEYAREDAKTDMDLHDVAEKLTAKNRIFDMDCYEQLTEEFSLREAPDTVPTKYKVGDQVHCNYNDFTVKGGIVHRIGRTMIHVKHSDGEIAAYAPKHVHDTQTDALGPVILPKAQRRLKESADSFNVLQWKGKQATRWSGGHPNFKSAREEAIGAAAHDLGVKHKQEFSVHSSNGEKLAHYKAETRPHNGGSYVWNKVTGNIVHEV